MTKALTLRPLYEKTQFHKSVINEITDPELRASYKYCRFITKDHAKTFYFATRFLPNHKQRAIFAIYALCRYIDDTVDEAEDLAFEKKISKDEIAQNIDRIRDEVKNAWDYGIAHNPILMAVCDTLKTYSVKCDHALKLIDGVSTDLSKNRYANFDELYDYSYKVASVVGLMTSEIFGYSNKEALQRAVDLGIAMQLTNIIRDIGEDLDRNRIYLPKEEMDIFGVTEEMLFEKKHNSEIKALIKYQVDRARRYYESAEDGIGMLSRDSRLPVWLARYNYARILDKVEEKNYEILNERVYLNTTEKLSILPASLVRSYLMD
jgi:phytoene synthase